MNENITIDDNDVVCSGSATVSCHQKLRIFPFNDDKDFYINFVIEFFDQEDENQSIKNINIHHDSNDGVRLHFRRRYKSDIAVSNSEPVNFASDSKYEYLGNFTFRAFGKFENHTIIVTYTIYREAIKP